MGRLGFPPLPLGALALVGSWAAWLGLWAACFGWRLGRPGLVAGRVGRPGLVAGRVGRPGLMAPGPPHEPEKEKKTYFIILSSELKYKTMFYMSFQF